MSKYCGNADKCPHCGLLYKDLRTGLSYSEVFLMLWSGSEDYRDWRYKRRSTVLGLWHQIKKDFWKLHLSECGGEEFRLESSFEENDDK